MGLTESKGLNLDFQRITSSGRVNLLADEKWVQARVFVSGRVQGVFFRAFVRQNALRVGVTGYVRNLPDGRIEAVFQGPRDKVQEIIEQVHTGPQLARVDKVSVQWEVVSEAYNRGFNVRY